MLRTGQLANGRLAKGHLATSSPLWPVGTTGPTDGLRPSVSPSHDLFSLYILLSVP